uniref:Reverse transcriptase domain-containing protein n=1 Tax=Ficedula albicollis TaxID=59894 RepID=A0A803WEQ2_FICAL
MQLPINVQQYPLPSGAKEGLKPVLLVLQNSPVWQIQKPKADTVTVYQYIDDVLIAGEEKKEVEGVRKPDTVAVYQYIDDVLIGEEEIEEVKDVQQKIISHLESLNLQIASEEIQKPPQEVKFLKTATTGTAPFLKQPLLGLPTLTGWPRNPL